MTLRLDRPSLVLAATAGAIAAGPLSAAPISVSETVTLGNVLSQGSSAALHFDVGAMLASQGLAGDQVVGGQLTVFGFSDAAYGGQSTSSDYALGENAGSHYYTAYGYSPGYSYSYCSWWSGCTYYYYPGYSYAYTATAYDTKVTTYQTTTHSDAIIDAMALTAGTASAAGTVSTTQNSTLTAYGAPIYDGLVGCTDPSCSYTYAYHRVRDLYLDYSGALSASVALDSQALADIAIDGILDVNVGDTAGQFRLTSASFDLLVRQPVIAFNGLSATAVPEPPAWPLAAVAIGAMLALRARRPGSR